MTNQPTLSVCVFALLLSAACVPSVPFECGSDAACVDGEQLGVCESSGFCSFPDGACAQTGRRHGEYASAPLSRTCVLAADRCVQTVVAGGNNSCVVRGDGALWCWGEGAALFSGGRAASATGALWVADAASGEGPLAIGHGHMCVRTAAGELLCRGTAEAGQTGDALTGGAQLAELSARGIEQLAAGNAHTCARLTDGTVWCWGSNAVGQLGRMADRTCEGMPCSSTPAPVAGLPARTVDIGAGDDHVCARLEDGSVWCWGADDDGQLGGGTSSVACGASTTRCSRVPVRVLDLPPTDRLAVGVDHACARVTGGGVKCWGRNSSDQLGGASLPDCDNGYPCARAAVPVVVPQELGAALVLAAGALHSCALFEQGLRCWGNNTSGQLGSPSVSQFAPTPIEVSWPEPGWRVVGVTAGRYHSCAWSEGGIAWCWGDNQHGAIGAGDDQVRAPRRMEALCSR